MAGVGVAGVGVRDGHAMRTIHSEQQKMGHFIAAHLSDACEQYILGEWGRRE